MEIEIVTTKKKLSKSIINQMPWATDQAIEDGKSLGYVINTRRSISKAILIKHNDLYYIIDANYNKCHGFIQRRVGRWQQRREFETEKACDTWWYYYQRRLEESPQQIFI